MMHSILITGLASLAAFLSYVLGELRGYKRGVKDESNRDKIGVDHKDKVFMAFLSEIECRSRFDIPSDTYTVKITKQLINQVKYWYHKGVRIESESWEEWQEKYKKEVGAEVYGKSTKELEATLGGLYESITGEPALKLRWRMAEQDEDIPENAITNYFKHADGEKLFVKEGFDPKTNNWEYCFSKKPE